MSKVFGPDDLVPQAPDKYMGVLVAAKYARELNVLPLENSPYGARKLTTMALEALASEDLEFRLISRRRLASD
ncbi:MAG: DNA-directed RNA polymerase subunit omega [Gemmatimonadota bacterium]|nr:DNA-directed RNA polymerase subunit omega [Gemmatimonadota bacterium]